MKRLVKTMPEVPSLTDKAAMRALVLGAIKESQQNGGPIRILEAGCGNYWPFRLDDTAVHITGVDLDAEALRIRHEERGDLDVEIVGDLRTVQLPPEAFDVAYCAFVLEHVPGAVGALDNMARALRPGGRLVVRVPDGDSVFGWLAKRTPHRTHVWYKRYVERKPHAGEPGHPPYPTVYDPVVSVSGMRAWASARNFRVRSEYCTNFYLDAFGPLRRAAGAAVAGVARCSLGRVSGTHNNLVYVLEKAV